MGLIAVGGRTQFGVGKGKPQVEEEVDRRDSGVDKEQELVHRVTVADRGSRRSVDSP